MNSIKINMFGQIKSEEVEKALSFVFSILASEVCFIFWAFFALVLIFFAYSLKIYGAEAPSTLPSHSKLVTRKMRATKWFWLTH